MNAIVFSEHGGPGVLRHIEVPDPHVSSNEVLVRVHACALNHLDLWVRKGLPGVAIPLPHIPGSDIPGKSSGLENGCRMFGSGSECCSSREFPAESAGNAWPAATISAGTIRSSGTWWTEGARNT